MKIFCVCKICLHVLILSFFIPSLSFSQERYVHNNKVIAKLKQNKLVTGIWIESLSLTNAMRIVSYNNYPSEEEALNKPMIDFVLIEMEHTPFDISQLRLFLLGLNSRREVLARGNLQPSVAAFVRIPADGVRIIAAFRGLIWQQVSEARPPTNEESRAVESIGYTVHGLNLGMYRRPTPGSGDSY